MKLPEYVEITDVCLRDGLQNLCAFVPTDTKAQLARRLIDAGFTSIEATSFVSPKWVPQMVDATDLLKIVKPYADEKRVAVTCLVPNLKGAQLAMDAGADRLNFVISVSEAHNRNNVNRTPEESFAQLREIRRMLPADVTLCLSLATAFGCPFGEEITTEKVCRVAKEGVDAGADELILADTIGAANPWLIEIVVGAVIEIVPAARLKLHLHDTQGMALANYFAAMQLGAYRFEAAAGGLGGCPYAPGASGNAASEDLNNMLLSMGIHTGVAQEKLLEASDFISGSVHAQVNSHMWRKERGAEK